jgi:signal transduction histidine kinase
MDFKMMRKNKLIFPLQDAPMFKRTLLALCPLFLLMLLQPWLPEAANQTPVAFHYPMILLAIWIGGSVPGIWSNIISSIYIFGFLKPELLTQVIDDPVMRMRTFVFYSSTISFLVIVRAFEKALKKSEDAIKHRDEFLNMISHELRTPLTAIKLNIAVVKDQLKDKGLNIDRPLNSIERSTNRQDKLISAMLDLAMIESGHLGIRKEECHLNDVVAKAVELASESLNFKDVQMNLVPLKVQCDKQRIEQAIFNLVHNAIKYGEQKPVLVTMEIENQKAVIKIKNSGSGIAETDRLKIFKKFSRPLQTSQVQGLGIGLYLSRHLVEMHEGRVELTSSSQAGTTFTVILPSAL